MWHGLKNFMSRLRRTLRRDRKQEIVELLGRFYADKMKDARQFRLHSEQMRYHHFRVKLERIADEEETHAQWLKDRIVVLGGEVPQVTAEPEDARNTWEDLRLDLLEEKHHQWELIDQLPIIERFDAATGEILRHILAEESNHRTQITDMLMRSDPIAEWPV
ncbi:MAG TPA: ferritin-like domain-containing protein [Candidatus Binatia bacterium]